jgi:hypothetical protein
MNMPADFASLKKQMEGDDMTGLVELAAAGKTDEFNFIRVSFLRPPQSAQTVSNYMNIDKVTTKLYKRGASTNITKLVKYMHIDTHDMMKIMKTEQKENGYE